MRLELVDVSRLFSAFEFQFHKGAIRTGNGQADYKASPIFQFHKGAIRTLRLKMICLRRLISIP